MVIQQRKKGEGILLICGSFRNFKKEYSKHLKDFRVATKQCYQDQEAECEFKVPVDVSDRTRSFLDTNASVRIQRMV